jgi:CheY-like chemotaxis protein
VDDERFNLMALSNVLERYRIKMETVSLKSRFKASSGKDCLKMIARYSTDPACEYSCKHYRVILLDIEMPEMDGYQTSECIRDLEKKMKITPAYIIAYTGYSGDDLRRRTSKAGMNDIISKPVRPKDFLMKINQLAGKSDE